MHSNGNCSYIMFELMAAGELACTYLWVLAMASD
jgi:hypothetical protein